MKRVSVAQYLFLIIPIIITIVCTIVFKSSWISTVITIVSFTGCFMNAIQNKWFFLVQSLGALAYGILSLTQGYYGEAIINLCYSAPYYLIGSLIRINNYKKGKSQSLNSDPLSAIPLWVKLIVLAAFLVGYGFFLKAIHSELVIFNTITTGLVIVCIYLSVARNPIQWVIWSLDSILVAIMWSPWIKGLTNLPIFILNLSYLAMDIYALVLIIQSNNLKKIHLK